LWEFALAFDEPAPWRERARTVDQAAGNRGKTVSERERTSKSRERGRTIESERETEKQIEK